MFSGIKDNTVGEDVDIAKIYARKLRQSITVLKTTKEKAVESISMLDKWNDERLEYYQRLYDTETNHSKIKPKQIEWERKVNSELKSLNAYQSTEIKILLVH
jgi:hypothetical protein